LPFFVFNMINTYTVFFFSIWVKSKAIYISH